MARTEKNSQRNKTLMCGGLVTIGMVMLLACPGIIGWQCYSWLKWGYWTPISILDAWQQVGLKQPSTGWIGFNKLLAWTLDSPLSLGLPITGAAIMWLGTTCQESASKPRSTQI
jgi:hypothetical protein